jgi:putative FmdB family regulatory protein
MPIYEYRCKKRHTFEVVQSMTDDPLTECIKCGAPAERVLYAPAVHFKGKGFYNTDYGTKKRNREKEAAKSTSSKDNASSNGSGAKDSSTTGDSKKPSESKSSTSSSTSKSSD